MKIMFIILMIMSNPFKMLRKTGSICRVIFKWINYISIQVNEVTRKLKISNEE